MHFILMGMVQINFFSNVCILGMTSDQNAVEFIVLLETIMKNIEK